MNFAQHIGELDEPLRATHRKRRLIGGGIENLSIFEKERYTNKSVKKE